jgi:hypothetical protein
MQSCMKHYLATWNRLTRYMRPISYLKPVNIVNTESAAPEAAPDQQAVWADLLEDQLTKNKLSIGIKRENRKVIIEIFPDGEEEGDYQPITARAALGYKQGAWLAQYFRLPELMQAQVLH